MPLAAIVTGLNALGRLVIWLCALFARQRLHTATRGDIENILRTFRAELAHSWGICRPNSGQN